MQKLIEAAKGFEKLDNKNTLDQHRSKKAEGVHTDETLSEGAEMDTQALHKIDYTRLI